MTIRVDSDEYRAWHEVGHATVCLHLGGDVDGIEFLDGDAQGHAVAHCVVFSEKMEKIVACGGFAAEFYLLKQGLAEQGPDDKRKINQVVFHNATNDREDFWGRKLGKDGVFTEEEDTKFRDYAIESVVPMFNPYLPGMQKLVRELLYARKVEGWRVKELLRLGIPR